ncbi:hypothetical protein D9M70_173440 [compost metagenome]
MLRSAASSTAATTGTSSSGLLPERRGTELGRAGRHARLAAAGGQCGAERGVLPGRMNDAQLLQAMNFLFNHRLAEDMVDFLRIAVNPPHRPGRAGPLVWQPHGQSRRSRCRHQRRETAPNRGLTKLQGGSFPSIHHPYPFLIAVFQSTASGSDRRRLRGLTSLEPHAVIDGPSDTKPTRAATCCQLTAYT